MRKLSNSNLYLKKLSKKVRLDILNSVFKAGKGHIGGAYSVIEILLSIYHNPNFFFKPNDPGWIDRDRLLLSKGHAGIGLYAVLAHLGYFNKNELNLLNQESMLGEHPDHLIPGVEFLSGSLGHGLSLASVMALADKIDDFNRKSVVILGEGDCYEGPTWEAALFSSQHKLNNLVCVLDRNKLIANDVTEDINSLEPIQDKWKSFGWIVHTVNGHDFDQLNKSFNKVFKLHYNKPSVIIANTIKGNGVSFMENDVKWHHGSINQVDYNLAKSELDG